LPGGFVTRIREKSLHLRKRLDEHEGRVVKTAAFHDRGKNRAKGPREADWKTFQGKGGRGIIP